MEVWHLLDKNARLVLTEQNRNAQLDVIFPGNLLSKRSLLTAFSAFHLLQYQFRRRSAT